MPLSRILKVLEVDRLVAELRRRRRPCVGRSIAWHIQPTCALTGAGVEEGIRWLRETLLLPQSPPQKRFQKAAPKLGVGGKSRIWLGRTRKPRRANDAERGSSKAPTVAGRQCLLQFAESETRQTQL